jgi:hypothetical protein
MNSSPPLRPVLLLCALLALTSAAQAQVRCTFVSMTGLDANDCETLLFKAPHATLTRDES